MAFVTKKMLLPKYSKLYLISSRTLVPMTGEMICTFCGSAVEEDESAGPQSDSRQALARFNEQMKVLYDKLLAVESIKLDPSVLEPEPVELGDEKGDRKVPNGAAGRLQDTGKWSGEATRYGFT